MTQLEALEKPQLATRKLGANGQLSLSAETCKQHKLDKGSILVEISLPGCILLLPQDLVLDDLMKIAQTQLKSTGMDLKQLNDKVKTGRRVLASKTYGSGKAK